MGAAELPAGRARDASLDSVRYGNCENNETDVHAQAPPNYPVGNGLRGKRFGPSDFPTDTSFSGMPVSRSLPDWDRVLIAPQVGTRGTAQAAHTKESEKQRTKQAMTAEDSTAVSIPPSATPQR